jgi:hypothetical protein
MADNRDVIAPRRLLFGETGSAALGRNFERVKEIGHYRHHEYTFRCAVGGEVAGSRVDVTGKIREGAGLFAPCVKDAFRKHVPLLRILAKYDMNIHQAFGIRKRQWAPELGFEHAEDRCVGTDTER